MTPIAAVVVAWHQPELTVRALRGLVAMDEAPDRVVCVAQQFTPAESERYERDVPAGVETIRVDENLGFAAAANLGMSRAMASGAQWVLLLNSDAAVERTCLSECLYAAETTAGVAAVGPAVVYMDRPDRVWWSGGTLDPRWGLVRHPGVGGRVDELPPGGETEFIPGCCVLYSADAWTRTGGFTESFFMYYEDADWCLRARTLGYRLWYVDRPLCRHAVGGSSGQRDQRTLEVDGAYFLGRNQLRAALDAERMTLRVSRSLAALVVWNGYNASRILRGRRRWEVAASYLRGVRDGLRNRMGAQHHFQ